jgi:DNA-directed RNA polymerase specialized sigma24 family protein
MAQKIDVQQLTLAGIAHRCARETELFFQRRSNDPLYCFELFRRAIVDHDQQAWHLVYSQYRPLVAGWVERHSGYLDSGEEVQYYVNRAFERMWSALTPEKFDRFPNLKSLLRYLQMCVHSAILDRVRRAELPVAEVEDDAPALASASALPGTAGQALERVQRQELWSEVTARLKNEQERTVVYASFVLALKPREICIRFPGTFRDVREVYRVKENVLARLGRDAELRRILHGDA